MLRIIICLTTLHLTRAFPTGAPCAQIDAMTPSHRGGRFDEIPPYRIRLSSTCYTPGTAMRVTLEGVDVQHTIKGFILQARRACRVNEDNQRVGRFLGTSNDWKLQCPNDATSITHTYKDAKRELTMDWVMTNSVAEEIQFIATVVSEYSTYWVKAARSIRVRRCGVQTQPCEGEGRQIPRAIESPPPRIGVVQSRCELPFDGGDYCGGYTLRYYHIGGHCVQFWYGGCGGNPNNFFTSEECKTQCATQDTRFGRHLLPAIKDICAETPSDSGRWCKPPGSQQRWSYRNGECIVFTYLGCGGSQNQFDTEQQCRTCAIYKNVDEFTCNSWLTTTPSLCDTSNEVRQHCPNSCCAQWERRNSTRQ